MIKTAIIGVSGYGKVIYDLCQECVQAGKMEISAVVIRTPSKVPDLIKSLPTSCQIFKSADELFENMSGKLDLVCIPTGINTHAPLSIAAMRAGANVMVEKPAAGSVAEVNEMIQVSKETGKLISVGFQDIFRTDIQSIKKALVDRKWGQLESVSVLGSWPRPSSYYTRNDWAGKLRDGDSLIYDSPANNALAHYLNLGLYLLGDQYEESACIEKIEAKMLRAYDIENFDTIFSRSTCKGGKILGYTVSHVAEENYEPVITLKTDSHCLVLDHNKNILLDKEGNHLEDLEFTDTWAGRKNIFPSIIEVLSGNSKSHCSLSIAKCHTEFIEHLQNTHSAKSFSPEIVSKKTVDGEEYLFVNDLLTAMIESTKNLSLPSRF